MSTSSTSAYDIDSDNPGDTFNHEEWIGVGRMLPENPNLIPMGLANFFAMLLEVHSVSILQATTFGFILSSNKKIGITIGKGKASDIRIKL